MKRLILGAILLLAEAALADMIVAARAPVDPVRVGAVLAATALILGAFVALTDGGVIRVLRRWAGKSPLSAMALPLLLLIPYVIYGVGARSFSWLAAVKLVGYVLVPTGLLLPDRHGHRESANWRDFLAMAVIAVPIPAGWLRDIWAWPEDLYFLLPLMAVCSGVLL